MTIQIAVRLPDEMVEFLDDAVNHGSAANRTALVTDAIERERRRLAAVRDAQILQERGSADDLDALVEWSASNYSAGE